MVTGRFFFCVCVMADRCLQLSLKPERELTEKTFKPQRDQLGVALGQLALPALARGSVPL